MSEKHFKVSMLRRLISLYCLRHLLDYLRQGAARRGASCLQPSSSA